MHYFYINLILRLIVSMKSSPIIWSHLNLWWLQRPPWWFSSGSVTWLLKVHQMVTYDQFQSRASFVASHLMHNVYTVVFQSWVVKGEISWNRVQKATLWWQTRHVLDPSQKTEVVLRPFSTERLFILTLLILSMLKKWWTHKIKPNSSQNFCEPQENHKPGLR